jgi:DNA-binding LacI/PurR family transcriptional regulator
MTPFQAAKARNMRIGLHLSIVGCDDLPASAFADPPLTTFRLNYYELGVAACSRMIDVLSRRRGATTGTAGPVNGIGPGSSGVTMSISNFEAITE